jgi:outer membrane immunogenic protein
VLTLRGIRIAVVALAMSAAVAGAARAADAAPATFGSAMPRFDSGFDWAGFYAGVMGTGVFTQPDDLIGLTGVIGYNAVFDATLLGAEGEISALRAAGGGAWEVQARALARGGVLIGDNVLVFAAGGIGSDLGGGGTYGLIGGGVEVGFSDSVSFRGQYLYGYELGGGADRQEVSTGALVHF